MSDEERPIPLSDAPGAPPPVSAGDAATAALPAEDRGGAEAAVRGATAVAEPAVDLAATAGRGDALAAGVAVLVVAALLLCAGLVLIAAG